MGKTAITAILTLAALGIAAAQMPGASPAGVPLGQHTTPSRNQTPDQAQAPLPPAATPISVEQRDATVDAVADLVEASYVDLDLAKRMAADLRQRKSRGEYSGIINGQALALTLLTHLRAINGDKHLGLSHNPQGTPTMGGAPGPAGPGDIKLRRARKNFGFVKVEVLDGNVGYLRVDGFDPPELNRATMAAAFAFLANVDAIIIDLRANSGGHPAAVALLASYLFNDRTHINDIYNRTKNTTTSYYTDPQAAAVKLPTQKVYLLTSSLTFSAGEGFVYNLQSLKRGLVIGEVTGGGAHPTTLMPVNANFAIALPTAKAVNPITKTNWEGKGVQPDVKVEAARALYVARVRALEDLIEATSEPVRRAALQQALTRAKAAAQEDDYSPIPPTPGGPTPQPQPPAGK